MQGLGTLNTSGHIRPRAAAEGGLIVAGYADRESFLESRDPGKFPSADNSIRNPAYSRTYSPAATNGQLINITGHQRLRNIARVNALFSGQVVVVCRTSVSGVRPGVVALHVVQEFGVGVGNQRPSALC